MKQALRDFAKSAATKIFNVFESNSGTMIIMTTAIGVFLSTIAQSMAIVFNKKYSVSQKAFMIPQEITEGAISIATVLVTTLILKSSAEKCVEAGKIISKDLKAYLRKNNAMEKFGTPDYSVKKVIEGVQEKIKNSAVYKDGSEEIKKSLLAEHEIALSVHEQTKDATSAIVTTAGSIVSTALFVPLIRNCVAAKFQPTNIEIIKDVRKKRAERQRLTTFNNLGYNANIGQDRMRV